MADSPKINLRSRLAAAFSDAAVKRRALAEVETARRKANRPAR